MPTAYCVKCRKSVEISNPVPRKIAGRGGSRNGVSGVCPTCGCKVNKITK